MSRLYIERCVTLAGGNIHSISIAYFAALSAVAGAKYISIRFLISCVCLCEFILYFIT